MERMVAPVLVLLVSLIQATLPSQASAIPPAGLSPSAYCGECHKDIYRMWSRSAHARALEDPVFQDALRETRAREGDQVAKVCLACHAPIMGIIGDEKLSQKITWEGVNCDVCHSIVSVTYSEGGAKQVFDPGPVKRGPIPDAASTAHEVACSELHSQGLVCAGCHEYVNPEGTRIMSTYSEWLGSDDAKGGRVCQDCHMGRVSANVVDPRVARVTTAEVNLHEVPGGHSLEQLHKALRLSIDSVRRGDTLEVAVTILNKGAGHAVPTGMPGRKVFLDVQLKTGAGQRFEAQRLFARSYVDASGSPVVRDAAYFARGVKLVSDSSIQAGERRVERFRWPVPALTDAFLSLKMRYEHAPTGGEEGRTSLTFLSEERMIRSTSGTGR